MNNLIKKIILGIVAVSFFSTSCTKKNEEEEYGKIPCDVSSVSYSQDIQPIIAANCAFSGCHLNPGAAAGRDWSTYDDVFAGKDLIKDRINRPEGAPGRMPQVGALTDCEIQLITEWINLGALDN